jgi:pyridoxal phosphate enzyme (YggS family)
VNESTSTPSVMRLNEVRAALARAAEGAGRDPSEVTLVAVSKTFEAEDVAPIIEAGQRVFGENRVQEAKMKWPGLREGRPDIELHLIGPLQTNKVRDALRIFDVIETVDREGLAAELAKEMPKVGRRPRLYVQVNTGEEEQKAGIPPGEADSFIRRCREVHGLAIEGLMCIPPAEEPPSAHFALLNKIAKRNGIPTLSMGMSADFEEAVQLGATHVRVGSAIFGRR